MGREFKNDHDHKWTRWITTETKMQRAVFDETLTWSPPMRNHPTGQSWFGLQERESQSLEEGLHQEKEKLGKGRLLLEHEEFLKMGW